MYARLLASIVFASLATLAVAAKPKINVGDMAPNFDLPVLDAAPRHYALSNLRGRVVLLDFWASWCGPCRQSFPLYDELRSQLPASDFTVLAVNLDDMIDGPRAFLEEHPVHYTSLADPDGNVAREFGLIGMPSCFVIDRNGVVRARHTGFKPADIDAIRKEVLGLIAEPTGSTPETLGLVAHPAEPATQEGH